MHPLRWQPYNNGNIKLFIYKAIISVLIFFCNLCETNKALVLHVAHQFPTGMFDTLQPPGGLFVKMLTGMKACPCTGRLDWLQKTIFWLFSLQKPSQCDDLRKKQSDLQNLHVSIYSHTIVFINLDFIF